MTIERGRAHRALPRSIFFEDIECVEASGAWSVHPYGRLFTSGRRASSASIAPPTLTHLATEHAHATKK